jgi:hypothetical protein
MHKEAQPPEHSMPKYAPAFVQETIHCTLTAAAVPACNRNFNPVVQLDKL